MSTKDFFWNIFQDTGLIGAYLVYSQCNQQKNNEEALVSIEESKG